jgi:hypothetical protein
VTAGESGRSHAVPRRRYREPMKSKLDDPTEAARQRDEILRRFLVPPSEPGTPEERAAKARENLGRIRAGVRITKAMYRPGR